MTRQPCLFIAASLLVLSHIGCASLKFSGPGSLLKSSSTAPAVRCLCFWQPVETQDITGLPVRGFGGQVYFFAADSEEPVAVEGDVRVFVFDDFGTPSEQARPKDIQDYDALVWNSFRNKSQVGTNYTLFVPYKSTSKYEAVCSLRLRLTRPDGSQLFSDMATVKLAGEPREDKSIRKLVSPREHSIRSDRSSELRVSFDPDRPPSNRSATIGSIREGDLSLAHEDQAEFAANEHTERRLPTRARSSQARTIADHADSSAQRYQAKLAEMHAAFERNNPEVHRSSSKLNRDISNLLPAIQQVSGREQHRRLRVTPSACEVFSTEEKPSFEPIESRDSQSLLRARNGHVSHPHGSQAREIFGAIEEDEIRPLELARILD